MDLSLARPYNLTAIRTGETQAGVCDDSSHTLADEKWSVHQITGYYVEVTVTTRHIYNNQQYTEVTLTLHEHVK